MASGYINGTTDNQYISARLAWVATPDYVNNRSAVTVTLQMMKSSASTSPTSGTGYFDLYLDGYLSSPWSGSVSIPNDDVWRDVFTWGPNNIGHGVDGTRALPLALRNNVINANYSGLPSTSFAETYLSGTATFDDTKAAPVAPTIGTLTRVSDTQHSIAWANNPATGQPYESLSVQRYDNVSAAWATIVNGLAGTTTSYTDTTTVANRRYKYRVIAVNGSGTGTSAASNELDTTPAAPSNLVATKDVSDIDLAWTDNATNEVGTEIWESQDGGAYALLHTAAAGATSWTHVAPSGSVTHAYKVRAKATTGNTLYSDYSAASATIQLLAAPPAPSALSLPAVFDGAEAQTLTWQHNPVDGTAQVAYQLRYRAIGDAWTELSAVTSGDAEHEFAAVAFANGGDFEVQVKTKGQHADYGPYSDSFTFATSARPTATISSPADAATLTAPSVLVEWAYYDAESTTQSARKVTVYAADGTTVLWTVTVADAAVQATPAYVLADGATYVIGVQVRDSDGLWSAEDTITVDVDYAEPMTPTLVVTYAVATGAATVAITNPAPTGSEPDATSNDLYRVIDGVAELVASGLPPNSSVTDYLPLASGTTGYYAVAHSALPSASTSATEDLVTIGEGGWIYLNGGSGYGDVVALQYGPEWQEQMGRERVLHRFAGQTSPVEFSSSHKPRSVAVNAVVYDTATRDALVDLAEQPGPHFLRDCKGRHMMCSLSGVSIAEGVTRRIPVSFTATRTQA
jgi:hypothetical protein